MWKAQHRCSEETHQCFIELKTCIIIFCILCDKQYRRFMFWRNIQNFEGPNMTQYTFKLSIYFKHTCWSFEACFKWLMRLDNYVYKNMTAFYIEDSLPPSYPWDARNLWTVCGEIATMVNNSASLNSWASLKDLYKCESVMLSLQCTD